jgi:hypothetical protein
MRHLLMDPAFPDIVGEWAEREARAETANDNEGDDDSDADALSDPLLALVAKAEIDATRLW